jgi:hypothetical protein
LQQGTWPKPSLQPFSVNYLVVAGGGGGGSRRAGGGGAGVFPNIFNNHISWRWWWRIFPRTIWRIRWFRWRFWWCIRWWRRWRISRFCWFR